MSNESPIITPGARVTLHYALSLADGTEVVCTFDETPLTFKMGDGTLTETLEQVLLGMSRGLEERIILSGDEAFGARSDAKIQQIAQAEFPSEMSLSPGQVIAFTTPAGDEIAGQIVELIQDEVVVDFNHPLSGHTLAFHVKILDIQNNSD